MNSKVTPAKVKEILRLRTEEKMPYWQIAQKIGLSSTTVQRIWYENRDVEVPSQIETKILDLYTRGLATQEIADQAGCSKQTVRAVLINCGLEDHGEPPVTKAFVRTHWGKWEMSKRLRIKFRNGYRVVYKGDPKSLKTPTQYTERWV